jgi:hypothetical protein
MTYRKRRFAITVLMVMVTMLVSGCGESLEPTTVESVIGTPAQEQSATSPLSTPTAAPPSRAALPTPSSSDVAVVGGILLRDMDGDSTRSAETKLQLARVIRSDDGTPLAASAGDKSSPTAVTDQYGIFVFADVPSDTYGLVLVSPLGSFMIQDETGADFLIDVEPGQVLDLGEIHTDIPY